MKWTHSFIVIFFLSASRLVTSDFCHSNSSYYYFNSGDKLSLLCNIPNDSYTFQYWVNPSNEYFNSTRGRFEITRVEHTSFVDNCFRNSVILNILNLTTNDSGFYDCFIKNDGANSAISIIIIVVDPIIIHSTSVNATVSVGESFIFSCNATYVLRRQWMYMTNSTHSHVLSNTSDGGVTITKDFDLQLANISLEVKGTYQCLLSNNKDCVSLFNTLTVAVSFRHFNVVSTSGNSTDSSNISADLPPRNNSFNEITWKNDYYTISVLSAMILFLLSVLAVLTFKYLKLRRKMKTSNKETQRDSGKETETCPACCLPFMLSDDPTLPTDEVSSSLSGTNAVEYEEIKLPENASSCGQPNVGTKSMHMTECVAYGHF